MRPPAHLPGGEAEAKGRPPLITSRAVNPAMRAAIILRHGPANQPKVRPASFACLNAAADIPAGRTHKPFSTPTHMASSRGCLDREAKHAALGQTAQWPGYHCPDTVCAGQLVLFYTHQSRHQQWRDAARKQQRSIRRKTCSPVGCLTECFGWLNHPPQLLSYEGL
ncbi:hypothetical protein BU26DRAFT_213964 [Trematosphaeria pertusa]|uniref:Uncharacterized protein n=1 Tax=Trematosphaeria pertusa TaxID=390896 RepID=A0A6A6IT84_9PLEO|nr:uncharacterized protein BU26DRAFT_213964 [Trematosphaeria pertusa]KAF2253052.1 hypothetical protein BU26DRAFT_213964 [Trematosphaeria pertusa]